MIFQIDLILFNIFKFLDNSSLLSCKNVDRFWYNLISDYKQELFSEPSWVRYNRLLEQSNLNKYGDTFFQDILFCTRTGYSISYQRNQNDFCLKISSNYPKKIERFTTFILPKQLNSTHANCLVVIPLDFCKDEQEHFLFLFEMFSETTKRFIQYIFDYTNLDNIFHIELQSNDIDVILKNLPYVNQSIIHPVKIDEEKSSIIFEIKNTLFFYRKTHLCKSFHKLQNKSQSLISQHFVSNQSNDKIINFGRYLTTVVNRNLLKIVDLSSSDESFMIVDLSINNTCNTYSYLIQYLELSNKHIIFLMGQEDKNGKNLCKFYYIFLDLNHKKHQLSKAKDKISFIWYSVAVQQSETISRIYFITASDYCQIVDVDLTNLKFIRSKQ